MKRGNLPAGKSIFTREEIFEHLQKVFASPVFSVSIIMKQFLSFIVGETLDGRANQLKEYTIAMAVLQKGRNFIPRETAVVRVHAARLRRALKNYYEETGRFDMIRITIPKGSYVPVFSDCSSITDTNNPCFNCIESGPLQKNIYCRLKTAIIPFTCFPLTDIANSFTRGFMSRLSTGLANTKDSPVIVFYPGTRLNANYQDLKEVFSKMQPEYLFTGDIQYQPDKVSVNIQVVHAATMEQVWGQIYDQAIDDSNVFEVQDEIIKAAITEIENFWLSGARMKSKIAAMAVA